jgi:hypothetical protein
MADILERGNIYFVYRPRVEESTVEGLEDVQRFFMILSPHRKQRYRLIVIGRKRLPEVGEQHERNWGFVQKVGRRAEEVEDELKALRYSTKTRGERHLSPARPAGEGVYAIARHDDHTHLVYALELPREPGPVQQQLHIRGEASYILTVKNPEVSSPPGTGLGEDQQPRLPNRLQSRFDSHRFVPADPPDFLDHEGTQLILIGAEEDALDELGIRLDPQHETLETAEIFNDLRMERNQHPLKPLFEGQWE